MKELSIEQKAKAYDEAIKRAKDFMNGEAHYELKIGENIMCWVFPELRESEDERMRAMAIKAVHSPEAQSCIKSWGINPDDVIAWLEKQVPACLSHDDEIMIRQLTEYFTTGKGLQNTNDTVVEWLTDIKRKLEKQGEQKPAEWSEEDDIRLNATVSFLERYKGIDYENTGVCISWLKSIKDRVQPQPKQEWSKEDKVMFDEIIDFFENGTVKLQHDLSLYASWLKSIRHKSTWKPSEEMLEALYRAIPENTMAISEDEMLLDKLYQGLKYGRVLSNK